jgi:hypothetical protein
LVTVSGYYALRYGDPGLLILGLFGLTSLYLGGSTMVTRRREPSPPVRLGLDGLTFIPTGWTVPWLAIGSCRVVDPYSWRYRDAKVRWRLRDPEAALLMVGDAATRDRLRQWLIEHEDYIEVPAAYLGVAPDLLVAVTRTRIGPMTLLDEVMA